MTRLFGLSVSVLFLAGAVPSAQPAVAAASDRVGTPRANVRLVTGIDTLDPDVAAIPVGLEPRLADGWHSYRRTPYDAGVAPRFDWSGSENVALRLSSPWRLPNTLRKMMENEAPRSARCHLEDVKALRFGRTDVASLRRIGRLSMRTRSCRGRRTKLECRGE